MPMHAPPPHPVSLMHHLVYPPLHAHTHTHTPLFSRAHTPPVSHPTSPPPCAQPQHCPAPPQAPPAFLHAHPHHPPPPFLVSHKGTATRTALTHTQPPPPITLTPITHPLPPTQSHPDPPQPSPDPQPWLSHPSPPTPLTPAPSSPAPPPTHPFPVTHAPSSVHTRGPAARPCSPWPLTPTPSPTVSQGTGQLIPTTTSPLPTQCSHRPQHLVPIMSPPHSHQVPAVPTPLLPPCPPWRPHHAIAVPLPLHSHTHQGASGLPTQANPTCALVAPEGGGHRLAGVGKADKAIGKCPGTLASARGAGRHPPVTAWGLPPMYRWQPEWQGEGLGCQDSAASLGCPQHPGGQHRLALSVPLPVSPTLSWKCHPHPKAA